MTQNYAVEQKKPSVLPRMILGTGVGAAAGFGLSKIDALKAPRYKSFDDILAESKDSFDKLGKAVENNETATKALTNIKNARTEFEGEFKKALKNAKFDDKIKAERDIVNTKRDELKNIYDQVLAKVKNGELGFKKEGIEAGKLEAEAKKFIKENIDKDDFKAVKEARDAVKDAVKAAADKAKAEGVKSHKIISEEATNALKEKGTKLFEGLKDDVKNFKVPKTKMFLGIGAGVGLLLALLLRPKAKKEEV